MKPSTKLSRRSFSAATIAATERVISDIDPKIHGNFLEHLGRCIDVGVFEEGSTLSDSNGFSSNCHWKDGLGPRDQRRPRLEMAWGTVESNRFGTHDFLRYTEMLGAGPDIQ